MGTIHRAVWRPPCEAGDFDFFRMPFLLRMLTVE
jgi:hypothetical protein